VRSFLLGFSVCIFSVASVASDWMDGMYVFDFVGVGESDSAIDMSGCNPTEVSITNTKAIVEIYDCDASDSPTKDCDLVVMMGEAGLEGWDNSPAFERFYRGYARAYTRSIGGTGGQVFMQCYGVEEPVEVLPAEKEVDGNRAGTESE
jgi:hypothetical protein